MDPAKIAAIGYCFGGTTVLELAYSGADLAGVVTFHGGLTAPKPDDLSRIKTRFLICHGANDGFISGDAINAFQEGMRKSGVDWQMIFFGGAVHGFTNPGADKYGIKGLALPLATTNSQNSFHYYAIYGKLPQQKKSEFWIAMMYVSGIFRQPIFL